MAESHDHDEHPIPARFLAPWLEDNAQFLQGIAERKRLLDEADGLRDMITIRMLEPCEPAPLAAVDAAVADISIGDLMTILIQSVHVDELGRTILGPPVRLTGTNAQELSLARTPLRLALECSLLAGSETPTIADTSFWSMLMEANQLITRYQNGGAQEQGMAWAYKCLITEGVFLQMLQNPYIIPMSKRSQAGKLARHNAGLRSFQGIASDREIYGRILQPGEFVLPEKLVDSTGGHFGVEFRGWKTEEREEIKEIYNCKLGVTYFKPHAWSRAFRIEAHMDCLQEDRWLMSVLSAIALHTRARTVEPFPQFMADYTAKHIAGVTRLYGELNFYRTPFFDPSRTDFY